MQAINTKNATQPLGHYSQAQVFKDLIFVSGQLGIDPQNPDKPLGNIREQTLTALNNIDQILQAAGSSKNKIVKTTIFLTDLSLWGAVNSYYAEFFGDHKPARSAVPIISLPKGYQVEIEAIAIK
jgi:2-iminobutanoate/2-iminopropanoate deaminase